MGAALAQVNGGALGEGPWGARPRRVAAPGGPRRAHLTVVPDLPAAPPSRGGRAAGVVTHRVFPALTPRGSSGLGRRQSPLSGISIFQ